MSARGPLGRRHLLAALPVLALAFAGVGFWRMLSGLNTGRFDPHAVSTPIIGKNIPDFPPLPALTETSGRAGFGAEALKRQTGPVLVNFMASWCIPCVEEMPVLRQISQYLPVWGIVYKDRSPRAAAFIERNGAPYTRLADDSSGRAAIDWGVTGVPENFLVLPGGKIAWHASAALDLETFQRDILPLLQKAPSENVSPEKTSPEGRP